VSVGKLDQSPHQVLHLVARRECVRADEHRDVRRDLVVSRARGVELPSDRTRDLGHPPLDRHVDVLVVGPDLEPLGGHLAPHRLERLLQRRHVVGADDALPAEHPDMSERLLDVVRRQPPVECDRAVERLEGRVLRFREAGQGPAGYGASAITATWLASMIPSV
jgi:hypothetical protein